MASQMRWFFFVLLSPAEQLHLEKCRFEILMVDDRPWKRLNSFQAPYWVIGAALNFAFAREHGYDFKLAVAAQVRPYSTSESGERRGQWDRVIYLHSSLQGMQQEGCKWILYLDSDAFWRSGQLQLQHMLEHLLSRYQLPRDCGTSGIFAREQPMQYLNITRSAVPPGAKPLAPFLNTGVFLLRADCPEALQLLDAWLLAAAEAPRKRLWNTWPAEQGILSELLVPGSYPPAATGTKVEGPKPGHTVAIVNMTEFNSPWGRFIHHAWGSEATDGLLRHQAMTDALLRIGAADPKVFVQLCRGVLRSSFWWQRWNWETLMETYAAAAK